MAAPARSLYRIKFDVVWAPGPWPLAPWLVESQVLESLGPCSPPPAGSSYRVTFDAVRAAGPWTPCSHEPAEVLGQDVWNREEMLGVAGASAQPSQLCP